MINLHIQTVTGIEEGRGLELVYIYRSLWSRGISNHRAHGVDVTVSSPEHKHQITFKVMAQKGKHLLRTLIKVVDKLIKSLPSGRQAG